MSRLTIKVSPDNEKTLTIEGSKHMLLELAQACINAAGWGIATEIHPEDLVVSKHPRVRMVMVDRDTSGTDMP